MSFNLPYAPTGQIVGLLGGSFDPPHAGHVHITHQALARFGLDRVWWLVSPGNPLKPAGPAPFNARLAACQRLLTHPRVIATDLESRLGTRYTADTLARLLPLYPGVRFVWLMGADNLAQFHRWGDWRTILERVPLGVLARPDTVVRAGLSPMARAYGRYRLPEAQSGALAHQTLPCWSLVTGPTVDLSSTEIRKRRARAG